jgi:endonuclease-3
MGERTRNSTPPPPRASGKPRAPTKSKRGEGHERSSAEGGAKVDDALAIASLLAEAWPDAVVELDHRNAYELLVATILAAQSTDKMINTITPALFAKYPDATALAAADPAELEPLIFKSGFYRAKARSLLGMARMVVDKHGGEVPETMEELVELPGVARKTANVVLGSALGKNVGIVVDTHVTRLANRLGLTTSDKPVEIEEDLMKLLPEEQWTIFAHRLIWHGRRVCFAKNPDCAHCLLAPKCPSADLFTIQPAAKTKTKTKDKAKPAPKAAKPKAAKPGRGRA